MAISLMTDKKYLITDFYQELYRSKSNKSKPSISSPEQSFIPQITYIHPSARNKSDFKNKFIFLVNF